MKNFLFGLAIIGIVNFIFSNNGYSKDLKIGYIDFFEVFNEYEKTKEYDAVLEKKKEEEDKKLDKKKEELEKIQDKLNAGALKKEEQEKEKENFNKAAKEYRELQRKIYTDLKKERDEKMQEILEDINQVIKDYAKENNFDLIVHSPLPGGPILYADKSMEITKEILKRVNEKYKKKK